MSRKISAAILALFGSATLFAVSALAYPGEELAKDAKITLKDATAIALKLRPGTIASQELEKEKGGSGLRFTFDIKLKGKTYEVGVDAVSGKVLENGEDAEENDAAEKPGAKN